MLTPRFQPAGEADMAVADLFITKKRMEAVEFSMPWLNIGISIIYVKPKKASLVSSHGALE